MASLPTPVNCLVVPPATSFTVVPAGTYRVQIADSSVENTQTGGGQFVKLIFVILDGEHKGERLIGRYNIVNQNDKAVQIALAELSAIGHAVGLAQITTTEQLHGRALCLRVSVDKEKDSRDGKEVERNNIRQYYYPSGAEVTKGQIGEGVAAAPTPAGLPPVVQQPAPAPAQPQTAPAWAAPAPQQQAAPAAQPAPAPAAALPADQAAAFAAWQAQQQAAAAAAQPAPAPAPAAGATPAWLPPQQQA